MSDEVRLDALAIGAHPDDVELGCGGTVLKLISLGYRVGVLDMARGEMGTRGTAEIRAREAEAAAREMKLTVRDNLELPDGHIWLTEESRVKMVRKIRKYRPRVIFTHYWEDPHPDHVHTCQIVREGAHVAGLAKYDAEAGQERFRPHTIAHFMFPRTVRRRSWLTSANSRSKSVERSPATVRSSTIPKAKSSRRISAARLSCAALKRASDSTAR